MTSFRAMNAVVLSLCISLTLASCGTSGGGNSQTSSSVLAQPISDIVKARTLVESYVTDVKQRYKPTDAPYVEARKRYLNARAEYDGYVVAVKQAIRDGNAKNLATDAAYRKIADTAVKASTDFIAYVEEQTGQPKAVSAIISGLVDAGVKAWIAVQNQQADARKSSADGFAADVQWRTWDKI